MTIAIDKLSFADYCSYTDRSDRRYELVDGELIPMSLGTGQHGAIAEYLNEIFKTEIRQQNGSSHSCVEKCIMHYTEAGGAVCG